MKRALTAAVFAAGLLAAMPARSADKLTVLLDWFVNPDHGTLIVAKEHGDFAAAGLDVELIAPADPNDPPKLVAAGKVDLGVSYQPQLHLQVAEGLPLTRIGTVIATPLNTVIVRADGPVKTMADLKGRKVGYSVAGFEDAILVAMLRNAGLAAGDVTLVNVNFALSTALLAGQVDAVVGGYRNFELNQMAIEGHPGRAFFPEEEGVPAYDELILVARNDRARDPRFRRFLDALERATLFTLNHPEEARTLFIKGRPELDDDLNRRAWRDTLPRFSHTPAALDPARYARFAAFLKDCGLIQATVPVPDYAISLD